MLGGDVAGETDPAAENAGSEEDREESSAADVFVEGEAKEPEGCYVGC